MWHFVIWFSEILDLILEAFPNINDLNYLERIYNLVGNLDLSFLDETKKEIWSLKNKRSFAMKEISLKQLLWGTGQVELSCGIRELFFKAFSDIN